MILQKTKNYSPDKLNSIKQLSDYKDLVLQYAPIENEYRFFSFGDSMFIK